MIKYAGKNDKQYIRVNNLRQIKTLFSSAICRYRVSKNNFTWIENLSDFIFRIEIVASPFITKF